jgi:biopolymer transport protein ExbB
MFEHFDWAGAIRTSPIMLVILACSVLMVGYAIERSLYFWKRRGRPDRLMTLARERIRAGRAAEAAWMCRASAHPVGAVADEVIRSAGLPAEAQEERLQIALSDARLEMERNLGVLGTMGNVAPLIGLLGTVWGIMRAFHDMANTGSAGPSVVAAGVAEALFTTGAGLMVAVPAVLLYNHFARRVAVMMTETENHARALRLSLSGADSAEASEPAARPPAAMRPDTAPTPAAARAA